MTEIQNTLFALRDPAYQAFQSRLIPTMDPALASIRSAGECPNTSANLYVPGLSSLFINFPS